LPSNRMLAVCILMMAASQSFASDSINLDLEAIRRANPVPTDTAVAEELRRLQPIIDKASAASPAKGREVPRVQAPPQAMPAKPARGTDVWSPKWLAEQNQVTPQIDIKKMLSGARVAAEGAVSSAQNDGELYVFLSLSIPDKKLRQLIELAADWGVTAVFRGPMDEEDMMGTRMAQRIQRLNPANVGDIQINPPLFQRFSVSQVPSYVLELVSERNKAMDNGCAPEGVYARVDGDVTPEYALRRIGIKGAAHLARAARRILEAK